MEFDTDGFNECPIAPYWIDTRQIEKNGIPKESL
jgi:hypothetical protein